jgi:hypothetical protein
MERTPEVASLHFMVPERALEHQFSPRMLPTVIPNLLILYPPCREANNNGQRRYGYLFEEFSIHQPDIFFLSAEVRLRVVRQWIWLRRHLLVKELAKRFPSLPEVSINFNFM